MASEGSSDLDAGAAPAARRPVQRLDRPGLADRVGACRGEAPRPDRIARARSSSSSAYGFAASTGDVLLCLAGVWASGPHVRCLLPCHGSSETIVPVSPTTSMAPARFGMSKPAARTRSSTSSPKRSRPAKRASTTVAALRRAPGGQRASGPPLSNRSDAQAVAADVDHGAALELARPAHVVPRPGSREREAERRLAPRAGARSRRRRRAARPRPWTGGSAT